MSSSISEILLIADCDGTLLRGDKTISQADLAAIGEFRRAGGSFTLATGRSLPTVGRILSQVEPELPVILYNGAMLYDPVGKRPLWMEEIPKEARFAMEQAMAAYGPELGVEVLTPEALHVLSFTPVIDEHLNGPLPVEYREDTLERVMDLPWLKVMFALPREDGMESFAAFLRRLEAPGVRVVRSERLYMEILPEEASKGAALRRLCGITGFPLSRTVAIGDCDNDLEMLEAAGVGCAVANAYPSLKAAAQRVTVSNEENAVAAVIRELAADPVRFFGMHPLPDKRLQRKDD